MKKILVVRFGTIGDTIFSSAFLRELRANCKDAQIDYLADEIASGVVENCPYINNIIKVIFNDKKWKDFLYYINIFRHYDTVYFLKSDRFLTKTCFFSGVKNRIGFDIPKNKFLTKTAPYNEDRNEIDCYLDLLKISDYSIKSSKTEVWIKPENEIKIQALLSNINRKKVIIQAYSRFSQKNWIDDYWVEVIRYLSDVMNTQVFYAGSSKDYELYENLNKKLMNIKILPINCCGQLSITEYFALIKNMDMLVGIDSGLIHAAAAMDIPSILLHGPTSLDRWMPRSTKCTVLSKNFSCSPCRFQAGAVKLCKDKTSECMLAITPNDVISILKEIFAIL